MRRPLIGITLSANCPGAFSALEGLSPNVFGSSFMTAKSMVDSGASPNLEFALLLHWTFKPHSVPTELEATLVSPFFDPRLARDGRAFVRLEAKKLLAEYLPSFAIDSFAMASIQDFLKFQAPLCDALEARLLDDRRNYDEEAASDVEAMWLQVRIDHLRLTPKDVPSQENLRVSRDMFYKDQSLEEVARNFDSDSTRSAFNLTLSVQWDDEHHRVVVVRDGQLASFDVM